MKFGEETQDKSYILNRSIDTTKNKSFTERKWVWIQDKEKCYVSGYIVKENNDCVEVCVNNEIRVVKEKEILKMNPPKFDMVEDLAALSHLNEPSVLHNLCTRYDNGFIYTYSGLFLLAVNPYRTLGIYNEKYVKKYTMNKKHELEPHIYGVANEAYRNMLNMKENQSILITGESGAGKTENTKRVIEFLAAIAGYEQSARNMSDNVRDNFGTRSVMNEYINDTAKVDIDIHNTDNSHFGSTHANDRSSLGIINNSQRNIRNARTSVQEEQYVTIDKKIIITNTILEAFGNAKTIKNDNSSRFGKFIQIKFNGGNIAGAHIEKYLLEKSRITKQNSGERNYHIFYQLLRCKDAELKKMLFLNEHCEFRYLNGVANIQGIDDAQEFDNLRNAFKYLGISQDVVNMFYKIVSTVLHLGNVEVRKRNDIVEIVNLETVDIICRLLEISSSNFVNNLLHPVIKAGHEYVTQSRSVTQVYCILEALAKILYDKMFDRIILELNKCLGTSSSTNFIGVLDIAGFEIFTENGFEQLCINYTNEKLQQFFNHHMFILEQEIYKQENIEWDFIDFGLDLQPVIDLIEKSNPIGILSYLDEECVMPMASDKTFLEKLKNIKNEKFKTVYFKDGFKLEHYAGSVEYLVSDWIVKNKDPNFENINELINKSENMYVSKLSFTDENIKKGFFRTVSQKHREQLNLLMKILSETNPHFVRCIIPNLEKSGDYFDNRLILEQLKCNGVLEGIRISRQGYPSRMGYDEFVDRYRILKGCSRNDISNSQRTSNCNSVSRDELTHNIDDANTKETYQMLDVFEEACNILDSIRLSKTQYRLGKTRIFFRQSVLADIEDLRDAKINAIMKEIQKLVRRKLEYVKQNLDKHMQTCSEIVKRNAKLCIDLQKWNWWKLYLKIKPLLDVRKKDQEMQRKNEQVVEYQKQIEEINKINENLTSENKEIYQEKEKLVKELEEEKHLVYNKEELIQGLRDLITTNSNEKETFVYKIEELQKQYEGLESVCKDNKDKIEKLQSELANCTQEKSRYLEDKNDLQNTVKQLLLEKTEIENNMKEMSNTMKGFVTQLDIEKSNSAEINLLKQECFDLKNTIKAKDKEYTEVCNSYEKIVQGLRNDVHKHKADNEKASEDMAKQAMSSNKTISEYKNRNEILEKEVHDTRQNIDKYKRETNDLIYESNNLKYEITKHEKTCNNLRSENEKYEKTCNQLEKNLEEAEKTKIQYLDEIKQLKCDIEICKINIDSLTKINKELESNINEIDACNKEVRNIESNKHLEKKINKLNEKITALENINLNLIQDKDELRHQHSLLVQTKMDEFFEGERQFNMIKKNLKLENKKLASENAVLKKEIDELRASSESSEDSILEKFYSMLDNEKELRNELEQKLYEYENKNMILQNKLCEMKKHKDAEITTHVDMPYDVQEIDSIVDNMNCILEGYNSTYYKVLEDKCNRIQELMNENMNSKNMNIENENVISKNKKDIIQLNHKIEELENIKRKLNRDINDLTNTIQQNDIKISSLEVELLEKRNTIDTLQDVYTETQEKYKNEILKIKKTSTKTLEMSSNMKHTLECKIQELCEINKSLKKQNEEYENKVYEYERYKNELELLKLEMHENKKIKDIPDIQCINIECSDIYKNKIQEVERKKLILEKELKNMKKIVSTYEVQYDVIGSKNIEYENEINKLSTEVLNLSKSKNIQDIKIEQIERDLHNSKEIISFLKNISVSRKSKKVIKG